MMIEVIITLTPETEKRLFARPYALVTFRTAVKRATAELEREVEALAPKATGDFLRSISSMVQEYGDPYRIVCRVYSTHEAADVIEFGAAPHVVPIHAIMRWMQAVGMRIHHTRDPRQVAFTIQQKIAQDGLKPKYVFSHAYDVADGFFHTAIDPVIAALGGSATYAIELRSSGFYVPK